MQCGGRQLTGASQCQTAAAAPSPVLPIFKFPLTLCPHTQLRERDEGQFGWSRGATMTWARYSDGNDCNGKDGPDSHPTAVSSNSGWSAMAVSNRKFQKKMSSAEYLRRLREVESFVLWDR